MNPHAVKSARKLLGLSQTAFADAVGLTGAHRQRSVRSWEQGKHPVPLWAEREIGRMLASR